MTDIRICVTCGGSDIYRHALVGINNPGDIFTFDDPYCQQCAERCQTEPYTGNWVIVGEETDDNDDGTGNALYWNNEDGWGQRNTATEYTTNEKAVLNMPQGALYWQAAHHQKRALP